MSWQAALLLLCLLILAVDCLVGNIQEWRKNKDVIKDSELNAHRVTPRFNVGSDAK